MYVIKYYKKLKRSMPEHRYNVAKYLGRFLKSHEIIHHIDEDPTNNELENLCIFYGNKVHMKFHWYVRRNKIKRSDICSNLSEIKNMEN